MPAAGSGRRLGAPAGKSFFHIREQPLLLWTLQALEKVPGLTEIIPIIREEDTGLALRLLEDKTLPRVRRIAPGGVERQDSVYNALKMLPPDAAIVLVHDGARPLIDASFVTGLIHALPGFDGVAPGLTPKETIKEVSPEGIVMRTLQRERLSSIQTPQVFRYSVLINAYRRAMHSGFYGTDDAMLVEAAGGKIKIAPGDPCNIKITTREDVAYAERMLKCE